jgi:hypothetical protein
MNNRHFHLLSASAVHFLTQDPFNIPRDAPAEREIAVETCTEEAYQTSTKCQLMTCQFRP